MEPHTREFKAKTHRSAWQHGRHVAHVRYYRNDTALAACERRPLNSELGRYTIATATTLAAEWLTQTMTVLGETGAQMRTASGIPTASLGSEAAARVPRVCVQLPFRWAHTPVGIECRGIGAARTSQRGRCCWDVTGLWCDCWGLSCLG